MLGPSLAQAQSSASAGTLKSCDQKVAESKQAWAQNSHSDLASVFHAEGSDIADTWCRTWETTGADRRFKAGDFGRTLFTGDGVHPAISSSLVPGSGLAGGANFSIGQNLSGRSMRLSETADARFSTNGSQSFSGRLDILGSGNRADNRHNNASIVATHQHLAELTYFGPGNSSSVDDESVFALDRTVVGGVLEVPLPMGFWISGQLAGLWFDPAGVTGATAPSIDMRFASGLGTPALNTSTTYLMYGGGVRWNYPRDAVTSGYATELGGTVRGYHETVDRGFSFALVDLAWTNRYVPNATLGSFSVSALATLAAVPAGDSVPFYLQPTVGGTDLNGVAVLRSFSDYRFRAPNRVAIVVEHEHDIAGPVGSLIFADWGQVAQEASTFDRGGFHDSFGAGITVRLGNVTVLKAFFAWGGGEGTRTTFMGTSDSFASAMRNRSLF
jgi:hypothetical protein